MPATQLRHNGAGAKRSHDTPLPIDQEKLP
jgi:hypothetical protein